MATKQVKAAQATNAIAQYVGVLFDLQQSNANANQLAFDLVKDCKDVDALNVVRDAFKTEYAAQYKARVGKDEAKCKAAVDMAWSRTMGRAKDMGYERPMADNAKAKKARDGRKAQSAGKVDGRTTKKPAAVAVIVPESDDDELNAAFDWVMESDENVTLFKAWVAAHQNKAPVRKVIRRAA
jgi:hypothetical protein